MYTIRTILGTTLGLTMSGVRHDPAQLASTPESTNYDFSERKAYIKLKEVEGKMDAYVATDFHRSNGAESKALLAAATERLKQNDIKGRKELEDLKIKLEAAIARYKSQQVISVATNPEATPGLRNDVANVVDTTRKASQSAIPANAPVSTPNALRPAPDSRNPQIRAIIDGYSGTMVQKENLLRALSRAEANFGGYDAIYERVTGNKPSSYVVADSQRFSAALDKNLTYLQQFVGGNAGLDALLSGKVDAYVKKVVESIKTTGKIPTVNVPSEGLSPQTQTIAGAIATALVAGGTAGIVMVGHEADRVQAETFMDKFKKDAEGGVLNTLGNALNWIKEAFMGRKLSITLGANEREGNVDKYYAAIKDFTKTIMSTPDLARSSDPIVQNIYKETKQFAAAADIKSTDEIYKKAIIQTYIMNEAYTREGVDWKTNIGLFFVGAGRESIQVKKTSTLASDYNKIESVLMNRPIDTTEIQSSGITITKNSEGKWVHTIPTTVQFNGDVSPLTVSYKGESKDGKYSIVTDIVQAIHFSDNGNGYELMITPLTNQPTGDTTTVSADVSKRQENAKVENIRDKKSFDEKLFYIGHIEPKVFGPLLLALGSQDIVRAKSELEKLAKSGKYRGIARDILKDFDKNAQSLATFTYGTIRLRARDKVDQKLYDKERNSLTLAAEERLARENSINFTTPELSFKSETYTPKQMSAEYPGQAMTLMAFATPLIRTENPRGEDALSKGVHRIDTMDGSFAVHNKIATITDSAQRSDVIDAAARLVKNDKRGIAGQLISLNQFLSTSGIKSQVQMDDYVKFLKSGNESDLRIAGLSVQKGKETKIVEARAMIAGNKCLNRTLGIIYPLFEVAGEKKQSSVQEVTLDYSTPIQINTVDTARSALGIGPVAAALKNRSKDGGNGPDGGTDLDGGGGTGGTGTGGTGTGSGGGGR